MGNKAIVEKLGAIGRKDKRTVIRFPTKKLEKIKERFSLEVK
jgi:predicted DNA binding CopG/RHH family protein